MQGLVPVIRQLAHLLANTNPMLVAAVIAAVTSQIFKVFYTLFKERVFRPSRVLESGGLPSSHSAAVCSLAVSAGLRHGFHSDFFAIVAVFAFIVLYDAAGIRYAVGLQSRYLNALRQHDPEDVGKPFKERLGHTPQEVLSGALWGVLLTVLFY